MTSEATNLERAREFRKKLWASDGCGHGRTYCDDCFMKWLAAEFDAVEKAARIDEHKRTCLNCCLPEDILCGRVLELEMKP